MARALLLAEREGWLSPGPSPDERLDGPVIRPSRQEPACEPAPEAVLNIVPQSEPMPAGAACPIIVAESRTGCPLARRPRRRLAAALGSIGLHLGVAVAAVGLLPAFQPAMEAERGGEPFLDMLVIGPEEAEALLEGAKPEPASQIVMPELPPPLADDRAEPPAPPIADVAVLEPVSPPLPVTEPAPTEFEPTTAAPVRVETVHEAEPAPPQPSPPPPVHPIARPVLPETIARKAPAKRALPPPRTRPEARGRQGDGQEVANRLAQSRGGTGGKADVAGHAALTTFRARIVAHLNRYKTYPEQAQERGLVGRNAVTLTLSREGRVLSAALSGPSGHALLDSATLAAVKRAQPFPAIPEGGPPSLTVTIGLNYQLQ